MATSRSSRVSLGHLGLAPGPEPRATAYGAEEGPAANSVARALCARKLRYRQQMQITNENPTGVLAGGALPKQGLQ
jgi:hypothetical protein